MKRYDFLVDYNLGKTVVKPIEDLEGYYLKVSDVSELLSELVNSLEDDTADPNDVPNEVWTILDKALKRLSQ